MTNLQHIGKPTAKSVDGLSKVMGQAKYIGDMVVPGMLYAKVLRSRVPHARIAVLDVTPALKVPGVLAVITSEDFTDHGAYGYPIKDNYVLAYQKVRYVGDAIAAVAAETEEAAKAGIKAIILKLEELPVVSDPRHALDAGVPVIPDDPPMGQGNLCNTHISRYGDPNPLLAGALIQLDETYEFAHQEHAYIETEGALAIPEPDGSVTVYASDQTPHINRGHASSVLGLKPEMVRIIQPPVGGSFGGKDDIVYECTAQVARLAMMTGRPVRLTLTRKESMTASYKRESMVINLKLGADQDGRLLAGKADMLADSGAYASMTPLATWRGSMHACGVYRYDAAWVDMKSVYTNNAYCGAFRGFGNTQATGAIELAMDEMAEKAGMDPLDFRLKNCLRTGDTAFTGNKLKEVSVARCLEWVRQRSDWDKRRAQYAAQPQDLDVRRGIGVACYFHGAGLGGEGTDYANITVNIEHDCTVWLQSGLTDYGQGSRTVFTLVAAETMGVNPERVVMPRPDTQTAMETGPTVASRSSIVGGNAVKVATGKLNHTLMLAAANLFDCDPVQVLRHGESYVGPQEEEVPFEKVVEHARKMGLQLSAHGYWQVPHIHWDFDSGSGTPYFAYSYGAQVAEVEVNRLTGEVKVLKIWAAHDAGQLIYPNGARGQLLGGIAMGLGYGLTEGFTFNNGCPEKVNFNSYKIPNAVDVPECDVTFIETTLQEGPYGAKNVAEPSMIATAPAIANGVYQATGVRIRRLPIEPDKLKK